MYIVIFTFLKVMWESCDIDINIARGAKMWTWGSLLFCHPISHWATTCERPCSQVVRKLVNVKPSLASKAGGTAPGSGRGSSDPCWGPVGPIKSLLWKETSLKAVIPNLEGFKRSPGGRATPPPELITHNGLQQLVQHACLILDGFQVKFSGRSTATLPGWF